MGLQLIFCVESNPKSQTDWIYIHETVRHYYSDINATVRLTPIFLSERITTDPLRLQRAYLPISSSTKPLRPATDR